MTEISHSDSVRLVDSTAASVAAALAALERHESELAAFLSASARDGRTGADVIGGIDGSLSRRQEILSATAEKARAAQDELAALDADLKQALDAVAAVRKYLQSA